MYYPKDRLVVDPVSLVIQKLALNVLLECAQISMNAWTRMRVVIYLSQTVLIPQASVHLCDRASVHDYWYFTESSIGKKISKTE